MGEMKKKKGFTVIEVALVLAIAGLIFLMVFVALPALRRTQRDAQRREDVLTFLESVKKYQQNNRGALPHGADNNVYEADGNSGQANWGGLLADYLGEKFMDPSGGRYKLQVINCNSSSADTACTNSEISEIYDVAFPNDYRILVVRQATCFGSEVRATANPRKIAAVYRLEGAGVYCANS